jgi:hypothetical protein
MREQTRAPLDPEQSWQVVAGSPGARSTARMFGQHLIEREAASGRG